MNLPEPTQDSFNSAEQATVSILQEYSTVIDSKKGSIVRELVIRPIAYVYARMNQLLSSWIRRTSVSYLSGTDDTSDSIADLVASNYFVTRKQGNYAKGILTLNCSQEEVRISANSSFFIDSHEFIVDKAYVATSMKGLQDSDELGFIKMIKIGSSYKANLPVIAVEPGVIEIPAGVEATISSYIPGCDSAQLLSPITGGSDVETNAQMMARCKDRCGAAVGTLEAIRTKMQEAPITVLSCNAIGSAQPGCFRAKQNSAALPMGGIIDIYVKTQNQNSVEGVAIDTLDIDSDSVYYTELNSTKYPKIAGACRILSVKKRQESNSLSLSGSLSYSVIFGSTTELSSLGARGSVDQKITIRFNSLTENTPVYVAVEYMPGVKDLEEFIDNPYQKFLGQDCQVKAAFPVTLKITGQIYSDTTLTEATVQQIKEAIAQNINSKQVGDYNLNMDKVAQPVQAAFPGIKLRLPYSISVQMPAYEDGTEYTWSTTDGTVSLLKRNQKDNLYKGAYFYSVSPANIELN